MWGVWAVWTLFSLRADFVDAEAEVTALRTELSVRSLLEGDGVDAIDRSADRLDDLARRLDNPLLSPLRFAPVVGRQLSAASHQADAASGGLRAAADISEQMEGLIDDLAQSGPDRIVALRRVAEVAEANRSSFDDLDLGPDEGLIGPLAKGRARLEDARLDALDALERAHAAGVGMAAFFEGPAEYLLLAANNAQMQNGQGMFLSAGVLRVQDGRLELDAMESTTKVPPVEPPIELDPDLAARWGWLDPNDDFRHLGLSHRFPVTARTAADLWAATGRPAVDGVIAVDPFLLKVIMKASGPVDAGSAEIGPEGVVGFVLHHQYQGYLKANGTDGSFTTERRDVLEDIAVEVLDDFERVTSIGSGFLEQLAHAAAGRHVLGWSSDPAVQAAWEAAGVDGQIGTASAMLSLVNRSGNKLDWFMRTAADLQLEATDDGTEAVVTITVRNDAPERGEPLYVVGPYPGSGLAKGEYLGLVTLNLPESARDARFDGVDVLGVAGGDGPNRTVAAWVNVPRGESTTLVARFLLPGELPVMTIEAGGRPWPTKWTFGSTEWNDARPRTIDLPAPR